MAPKLCDLLFCGNAESRVNNRKSCLKLPWCYQTGFEQVPKHLKKFFSIPRNGLGEVLPVCEHTFWMVNSNWLKLKEAGQKSAIPKSIYLKQLYTHRHHVWDDRWWYHVIFFHNFGVGRRIDIHPAAIASHVFSAPWTQFQPPKLWRMRKPRLGRFLLMKCMMGCHIGIYWVHWTVPGGSTFAFSKEKLWSISQKYDSLLKLQREYVDAQAIFLNAEGHRLKAEARALSAEGMELAELLVEAQKHEREALGLWWGELIVC